MKISINDMAYCLGPNKVTNDDLARMNPEWDMAKIETKTGILIRHYADPKQTSLDLGIQACEMLVGKNPRLLEKIDGILFCTTSADYLYPKNSYLLHGRMPFSKEVFCLDIGLACSGFVYSMAVAQGLIATGVARDILIITAETLSKFIHDKDRSSKSLFSDGACATWVSGAGNSCRMVDTAFGAIGKAFEAAYVPGGRCRIPVSDKTKIEMADESGNIRTLEEMVLDGRKLLNIVGSNVPRSIKALLKQNRLSLNDIDMFVFHQGSKLVVDAMQRLLRIPTEKTFRNYGHIGNTSSAALPIALKDAMDQKIIKKGDRVLISAFGAGFSWGSAIMKI